MPSDVVVTDASRDSAALDDALSGKDGTAAATTVFVFRTGLKPSRPLVWLCIVPILETGLKRGGC